MFRRVSLSFQTFRIVQRSASQTKTTNKNENKSRTPMGKLDETPHPDAEKQPLERWPDNVNPVTGEINGPRGPEPTRYGDWERKGKCVDF